MTLENIVFGEERATPPDMTEELLGFFNLKPPASAIEIDKALLEAAGDPYGGPLNPQQKAAALRRFILRIGIRYKV